VSGVCYAHRDDTWTRPFFIGFKKLSHKDTKGTKKRMELLLITSKAEALRVSLQILHASRITNSRGYQPQRNDLDDDNPPKEDSGSE
jgi:hypothetical protein